MKKTMALLLLVIAFQVVAQTYPITNINISMPPNPDATMANWGKGNSVFVITATGKSIQGHVDGFVEESKILVTIKKGGTKVCGSYTANSAPASNFNTVTKVWSGTNAVSLIGQDCILPSGDYEICVQFFGYGAAGPVPLSEEKRKMFSIRANDPLTYQPPQAITPAKGTIFSEIDIKKPITFRWTPVVPKPQESITYRLKVWQLMQGQNGMQAMKTNPPIVTKDIDNLTQATILNLITGPCKPPYLCDFIWNVQALTPEGKPIGGKDGTSELTNFGVNKSITTTPPNNTGTTVTICNSVSLKSFHTNDIIHLSDGFNLTLSSDPTGNNENLTGTGTVLVKWLGLLNVQFKNIKINADDYLCQGAVYTVTDANQVYPTQWAVNVINNNVAGAWTVAKIKDICDFIKTNQMTKPLVSVTDQIDAAMEVQPLNMPLGYFKNQDTENPIGFTEMVFRPDNAEFEAAVSLNADKIFKNDVNVLAGTKSIALKGEHILFTKTGLKGINGTIKLLQPITFNYTHAGTEPLKLTFNVDGANHIGNGIVFSNNSGEPEFWKYNMDVDAQLPKEWVVPADVTKTNVTMNFQMSIVNWSDWLVQGTLPPCTIPKTNGLGVEIGTIIFDNSEIENAATMVFPTGYTGDRTVMFSGFYLKDFKLTLPDQLRSYADTTHTIKVDSHNLIIDRDGITGEIIASNVLTYPLANIGNLGASIDNVSIKLSNSTLTEAKMLGQITLPMSNTDAITNAINYKLLFLPTPTATPNSSLLVFSLLPDHDIKSRFFGDGKMQIDQTSALNFIVAKSSTGEREISLNIDINGELSYPAGKIIDPSDQIPMDLDLSCKFEHMEMIYKKNATQNFTFNVGNWAFASPQKYLFGFPYSITEVKPFFEPIVPNTDGDYLFKGGIEFVAKINIGNDKIAVSGDAKIRIVGAVISSEYGTTNITGVSAIRHDWQFLTHLKAGFLKVNVSNVHVDFRTSLAEIIGDVELKKNDLVYGTAFKGELTAKFTTLKSSVNAGAVFGNTKYRPGNTGPIFKYWMVQAQVNLPKPGLPFMTGLVFRGFGGGVYSRMNMVLPTVFNASVASNSTFGGAIFTPDYSVGFGFKAKAIIATTPKEEMFNGSVALQAQFSPGGTSLQLITFTGLFNCGAEIGQEAQSFANGQIIAQNDFVNKTFDMNVLLNIDKAPITTPGGINVILHIDSKQNKWFFQCGKQQAPNKVRVTVGAVIDFNTYLMFGNDIVKPTGFMAETVAGFNNIGDGVPRFIDKAFSDGQYQSAKGFAFGIGVNGATHGTQKIGGKYNYANVNWNLSAGGEIDSSLLQYTGCGGLGQGWRAKAEMGMYVGVNLGYAYHTLGKDRSGTLASIKTSAAAAAEFPKDIYFEGDAIGNIVILDIFEAPFHQHFKYGNPCNGTLTSAPDAVYAQEDVETTLANQASTTTLINKIMTPGSPSNIARNSNFSALLNYPYNEPFDLQEQQSSGQIKVRTFRAFYTQTLTRDSISSNSSVITANLYNNLALATAQHTTATTQSNGVYGNLQRPNTSDALQVNTLAMQAISFDLDLISAGYDALGAKLFKLAALQNIVPSQYLQYALKPNRSYKFEIIGILQEKIGNNWQSVNRVGTSTPIRQVKRVYFKTNSDIVTALGLPNTSLQRQ
jgi:hypothetical protein